MAPATPPRDTTPFLCDGLTVSTIAVETRRPTFRGPLAVWRRFAHWIGLRNTETQEPVVRRYVTLDPAATCTEFRRAESERLLRAQPFIATASVRAQPHGTDSVRLLVETVDEVPAIIGGRYRARDWALAIGNENTFGTGTRALLRVEQRDNYRNGFGIDLEHRQLLGKPYTLGVEFMRHPVGDRWMAELGHAFLTDLQRIAWHTGAAQRRDYVRLQPDMGDELTFVLPLRQTTWDIGGILRFGPPGRTFLNGGVLTGERVTPAEAAIFVTDTGIATAPGGAAAAARYRDAHSVRANFVTGFRSIRYVQGEGMDALTARQDLANGLQVSFIVGKSVPGLSEDDDGFLASELFLGRGGPRSYLGLQIEGEARRAFGDSVTWDGILGSARTAWYFKPVERMTSIVSLEWAGGWRERFPFLLELGDRQGGVRGFGGADIAGARRAVARVEERWVAGQVAGRADVGVALFGEAGKVWAGDAPFGQTSALASSVGISLLAAVPIGGQRLYRMDVAFPVRGPDRGVEVRFGASDRTRHFWETPDDVMRARAAAIPQRIFDWP